MQGMQFSWQSTCKGFDSVPSASYRDVGVCSTEASGQEFKGILRY